MVTQSSEKEGEMEKEEEEKDDEEKVNELKMCEETVLLLNTQNSVNGSKLQSNNLSSPNNSQEIVNTHIQNQTTAQGSRQSEIEDKNVQQIQNVHHTEKKLDSTGIDVGFANYHVLHINKFTIFIKKQSNEFM